MPCARTSYRQQVKRDSFRREQRSLADFIEGLELNIRVAECRVEEYSRMAQLTQRTNQFNTTTQRRTRAEIAAWVEASNQGWMVVRVKDRFGDYGLVGTALYASNEEGVWVDSMMLSCRVLGRGVEYALINALLALGSRNGANQGSLEGCVLLRVQEI